MPNVLSGNESVGSQCNGNQGCLGMYPSNGIELLLDRAHDDHAVFNSNHALVLRDTRAETSDRDGVQKKCFIRFDGVLLDPWDMFEGVDPVKRKLIALLYRLGKEDLSCLLVTEDKAQVRSLKEV